MAEKQRQGEYQKYQSDTFVGDTDERLAVELGVSAPTINRDAAFALAVDYLRGKRYLAEKQRQGEYQKANSLLFEGDTSERLAAELGVSDQTIRNDAAFALAVDYTCGGATRY